MTLKGKKRAGKRFIKTTHFVSFFFTHGARHPCKVEFTN